MSSAVDSQEAPQTAATTGPLLHVYCPDCVMTAPADTTVAAVCGHPGRSGGPWMTNPQPQDG